MANSRVGQHEIEYNLGGFGAPVNAHTIRCLVKVQGTPAVGTDPALITVDQRGGGSDDLLATANTIWSYLRLGYAATVSAAGFSLWRWVTNTQREFVSAGAITTPAGATGSVNANWQTTLTFRSGNGGVAKLVFIEGNFANTNARTPLIPNPAGFASQRIAAFMISAQSPMIARDNGFMVAAINENRGENEAIRNRRLGF